MENNIEKLKTYNINQVADILGMNKATVKTWCKDGELTYIQVKPGGKIIVKETDLIKFMDKFRCDSQA